MNMNMALHVRVQSIHEHGHEHGHAAAWAQQPAALGVDPEAALKQLKVAIDDVRGEMAQAAALGTPALDEVKTAGFERISQLSCQF